MDVLAQITQSLVRLASLPPVLPAMFSSKRMSAQKSLFSLAIIVILLPPSTWIKQNCLMVLAGQRGCENSSFAGKHAEKARGEASSSDQAWANHAWYIHHTLFVQLKRHRIFA